MKRAYILLIIIALLLSFAACAEQAEEEPESSASIEPVAEPTEQSSQESEYSPTPKPTLSPEEKRILEKYNGLLNDCTDYNDWSAAVMLKDMLDAGEISDKEFYKLAQIPDFEETRDLSDEVWAQVEDHVMNISSILNGQHDKLDEAGMEKFYNDLCVAAQQGTVYLNALDSQEKLDRVAQDVAYVNQWIQDDSEENYALVQERFMSDELTSGEIVILGCYMYFAHGEDEDRTEFLDEQGVQERIDKAISSLLEQISK